MYEPHEEQRSTFRPDVPLHQLLSTPVSDRVEFQPIGVPQRFPDPLFPQHPELLRPVEEDASWRPPEKRHWTAGQIYHGNDKINAKLKIPATELSNQSYHGIKLHKVVVLDQETQIHHVYAKSGEFWPPEMNRSESLVRLGGTAVLTIDYGTYQFEEPHGSIPAEAAEVTPHKPLPDVR